MIKFHQVFKSYGRHQSALSDIHLHIEPGEFIFITGASGAGKSTLLRLLFCADKACHGQIFIDGCDIARLSKAGVAALRRKIGVVFQDFKLLHRRTVEENVAISLEVRHQLKSDIQRRTLSMLEQVGLLHKQHQLPAYLSGGEQLRVAVARAVVHEPSIVLADEPTGNLDHTSALGILHLLKQANLRGATIIVATHDETLLQQNIPNKRVIELEGGRLC